MKKILILLVLVFIYLNLSQSLFGQVPVGFVPPQKASMSDEDYRQRCLSLQGAYDQIRESDREWVYGDYWNVAVTLYKLEVGQDTIKALLEKGFEIDPVSFCQLQEVLGPKYKDKAFKRMGDYYPNLCERCKAIDTSEPEKQPLSEYCVENGYDLALVQALDSLIERDQRYRGKNDYRDNKEGVYQQEHVLDPENMVLIEAIVHKYGYPGKSMVGKRFQSVACLVIEHAASSDSARARALLPEVAEAYRKGEIFPGVIRMLLDRLQVLEDGTQIFGSHAGVPFAEQAVIDGIRKKYQL
ncbi:MAG: DUF6624 domain-containing protein [Bacteroidota bacterium]